MVGNEAEVAAGPDLIVVGGGIAGSAAALRAAQYHLSTVWILGDASTHKASRARYVKNIDNMVGIHPGLVTEMIRTHLGDGHPEAIARIDEAHLHIGTQAIVENVRHRIEADWSDRVTMVPARATEASASNGGYQVTTGDGAVWTASALILATGVMDRQPIVRKERHGRDLHGIQWVFPYANQETFLYCIRCEGHLTVDRPVAVIGAGESAAEVALMLRERYGCRVTVVTAGEEVEWSSLRGRLLELQGIRVATSAITDISGADRGATLNAIELEGGERVEVELAFVAMGIHRVYNDLALQLGAELESGPAPPEERQVLIDARGETSIRGLFAIGDLAQRRDERLMKQIYTAQEYAVRAVDTIDDRRRQQLRQRLLATRSSGA